jgi:hypothetical protein
MPISKLKQLPPFILARMGISPSSLMFQSPAVNAAYANLKFQLQSGTTKGVDH